MLKEKDLALFTSNHVECADGRYRIARPLPTFLSFRIKDAWEVLCGRAEALKTYNGTETED